MRKCIDSSMRFQILFYDEEEKKFKKYPRLFTSVYDAAEAIIKYKIAAKEVRIVERWVVEWEDNVRVFETYEEAEEFISKEIYKTG